MSVRGVGLAGLVFLLVVPGLSAAQVPALEQGSMLIGGSAGFSSSRGDGGSRFTNIGVAPSVQYFVVPGLAVGGSLPLGALFRDDETSVRFGIGPAATYFFVQAGPLHPFLDASVRYEVNQMVDDDRRSTTLGYDAGLGVMAFLNEAIGVHARLYYRASHSEFEGQESEFDTLGLSMGVSTFLF